MFAMRCFAHFAMVPDPSGARLMNRLFLYCFYIGFSGYARTRRARFRSFSCLVRLHVVHALLCFFALVHDPLGARLMNCWFVVMCLHSVLGLCQKPSGAHLDVYACLLSICPLFGLSSFICQAPVL